MDSFRYGLITILLSHQRILQGLLPYHHIANTNSFTCLLAWEMLLKRYRSLWTKCLVVSVPFPDYWWHPASATTSTLNMSAWFLSASSCVAFLSVPLNASLVLHLSNSLVVRSMRAAWVSHSRRRLRVCHVLPGIGVTNSESTISGIRQSQNVTRP